MSAISSPLRRSLGLANAAACLLLLVAGGLVTSTASGLAVPDWPLSFGKYFPDMSGGVFYEHGHRVFAGFVGLAILGMAVLTQREDPRPGVRRLAWATALCVGLQALLGGLTVLYGLPVWVSAAHATLGQTVFVLLVLMAELVGEPAPAAAKPVGRLPWLACAAVAALWLQLLLGAVLRHGEPRIGAHLAGAFAATVLVCALGVRVIGERGEEPFLQPALALAALLVVQLLLGAATALFRGLPDPRMTFAMIGLATAHLAVGAFLLAVSSLLALRLFRAEAR